MQKQASRLTFFLGSRPGNLDWILGGQMAV